MLTEQSSDAPATAGVIRKFSVYESVLIFHKDMYAFILSNSIYWTLLIAP